jgi:hypothetical protein
VLRHGSRPQPPAGRTYRETCTSYPEPRSSWRRRRGGRRDGPRPAGDLTTSTSAPASRRDGPGGWSGPGCPTGFSDRLLITRARLVGHPLGANGLPITSHRVHIDDGKGPASSSKRGQVPNDDVITINTRNVQNGAHRLVVMTHARQIRPNEACSHTEPKPGSQRAILCSKLVPGVASCSGPGDPQNPPAGLPLFPLHFNRAKHSRVRNGRCVLYTLTT